MPRDLNLDKFGVKKFYPNFGLRWFNRWGNGHKRTLSGGTVAEPYGSWDPDDTRFGYTNGQKLVINGDGTATIPFHFSSHRIYVDGPWTNTEQTIYCRFRADVESLTMRSRSNHHGVKYLPFGYLPNPDDISCGFGNYIVHWDMINNTVEVKIETIHALYRGGRGKHAETIPKNEWVGFKQITQTIAGQFVKVEGYLLTDTSSQDNWFKSIEFTFDGNNAACTQDTLTKCAENLEYCKNRGDKLSGDINSNQLWFNPGKWNWVRVDEAQDVDFKYYSVREIAPG